MELRSSIFLQDSSTSCRSGRWVGAPCRPSKLVVKLCAQRPTAQDATSKPVRKLVATLAASIVLVQAPSFPSPAAAYDLSAQEAFLTKADTEMKKIRRTLLEAWGIIRDTYVDPTFNKQDWDLRLERTMKEILPLKSADAVYEKIRGMLSTLGDPFTRIVTPQEFESFRINSEGSVEGVGLLLRVEPETQRLVVLTTLQGGPAERGGIRPGDELVQIDGEELKGMDGEAAAQKLRGKPGSMVRVKFSRTVPRNDSFEVKEVDLKREAVSFSPVFSAVLQHADRNGLVSKTGYIRLSSFSQNAAEDMRKAISTLEDSDVDSYILDLRNNPGGLVKAGLDVAEMWLDGNDTLVNTVDRHGITFPINIARGHALTKDPLVILVNEGSASASEILAGALHDNGRALIVGQKTYGKGKIQSVSKLDDGSALFVTVAKYLSPSLRQIDQVGITPDVLCAQANSRSGTDVKSLLENDACVLVAERLF